MKFLVTALLSLHFIATCLCAQDSSAFRELPELRVHALSSVTVSTESTDRIFPEDWSAKGSSIPDLLSRLSGVQTSVFRGTGASQNLSLRGIPHSRIAIYLDGVPLNESSGASLNLGAIDPSLLEQVEIYRSFVPARLGGNGLGGAIHLVSKKSLNKVSGRATLGSGAFGYGQASVFFASPLSARWDFSTSLSLLRADNNFPYEFDSTPQVDGDEREVVRQNAQWQSLSGLHRIRNITGKHSSTLIFGHQSQQGGVPGSATQRTESAGFSSDTRYLFAGHSFSVAQSLWKSGVKISSAENESHWNWEKDRLYFPSVGDVEIRTFSERLDAFLRLEHGFSKTLMGTFRLDAKQEELLPEENRQGSNPTWQTRRREFAVVGEVEWSLLKIFLLRGAVQSSLTLDRSWGGISVASSFDTIPPSSETRSHESARVGLRWEIFPALSLYSNTASYYRLPDLSARFGSRQGVLPNPDLKTETSWNSEVGLRWKKKSLGLRWTLFRNLLDNVISYTATGGLLRPENLEGAEISGSELSLQWIPFTGLETGSEVTWQKAISSCECSSYNGDPLPGEAELYLHEFISWKIFPGLSLRQDSNWKSLYFGAPGGKQEIDSRWIHDLRLSWNAFENTRLSIAALNLGDERERRLYLDIPQPGRRWFLNFSQTI